MVEESPRLANHYAVLIAGSNTFANYRHQADVCHAYQVVIAKGIPPENVIVMAYDDIAQDHQNPFPGKLFNKPTPAGTPGRDVYAGCKIDWRGSDVTVDNFIKVLTGDTSPPTPRPAKRCNHGIFAHNKTTCSTGTECCCTDDRGVFSGCTEKGWVCCAASETCVESSRSEPFGVASGHIHRSCKPRPPPGRVLQSSASSRVFVNFVDHGGVGIIGFPEGMTMSAQSLNGALQKMHDKGMYKELVFYLEACESGSMFAQLPKGISVYATTAANAQESSWGTYCTPEDKVDGKSIGSCLGDLYSVKWMEDSDALPANETLEAQFQRVKKATTKSHVTEFGDAATIAAELVTNFQGATDKATAPRPRDASATPAAAVADDDTDAGMLDSRAIELQYAFNKFMTSESAADADALKQLVDERVRVNARFAAIAQAVAPGVALAERPLPTLDLQCHHEALAAYHAACVANNGNKWTTSDFKHGATLAKLCAETAGDHRPIAAAIRAQCV